MHIAHLSDIHFGALRAETVEPLLETLGRLRPGVAVVSGDLTQRATSTEFQKARAFLDRIPCPRRVVVPGNHDIPLWNLWRRFADPRGHFDRAITAEVFPSCVDDEIAVVGIDTTRSMAISHGRVNVRQLVEVAQRFREAPVRALRVLTCHHPFVLPEELSRRVRAGRSDMALAALVEHQVDLLLTGHRHVPWVSHLGTALATVHAGTATSSRTRGVENSFNDIVVDRATVAIRRFVWDPETHSFTLAADATRKLTRDTIGRVRWTREADPHSSRPAKGVHDAGGS